MGSSQSLMYVVSKFIKTCIVILAIQGTFILRFYVQSISGSAAHVQTTVYPKIYYYFHPFPVT